MKVLSKVWKWITGRKDGYCVYQETKCPADFEDIGGRILVSFEYGGQDKAFFAQKSAIRKDKDGNKYTDQIPGYPVYHGVDKAEDTISEDELSMLIKTHVVMQALEYLEVLRKGGWNMKTILIWILIAVAVWYAWDQGWIQALLGDIIPPKAQQPSETAETALLMIRSAIGGV